MATSYPDFSQTKVQDNNYDKAIGGRIHGSFFADRVGVGGSVYRGRFSAQGIDGGTIFMTGMDGQLKLVERRFEPAMY